MQIQLLEATSSPDAQVDTEACVIRNVKVIGRQSRNGRVYGEACLREAIPRYEGLTVNCDHRQRSPDSHSDRLIAEQFGWLERVREHPTGLMADLHYLASCRLADQIVETARRRPGMLGLSHEAIGDAKQEGDVVQVNHITEVFSVDVVTDPATTDSLFESKEYRQMPEQNAVLPPEAAPADPLVAPDVVTDAPPADPVEAIVVSFRTAAQAVLDDVSLDEAAVVAAIKELMRARDKVVTIVSGEAPAAEPAADAAPAEKPTPESFQRLRSDNANLRRREHCRNLLESAGRAPTTLRVAAVAGLTDEKLQLQLIESFPRDSGSVDRPRSMPLSTVEEKSNKPVTDGKSFAAAVTG